ncbi:MAG: TetM/TetW/TetO/TetS family tetracycline resistance ribosomal protection protein, partial [Clostridia bacterium]|nr:TetM/TetW/TetO/TetS family tetracycline resistance ribosomal protection protein [Clostridia bacterium]
LMGEVQREILKSLIAERFNIDVEIDSGSVMYKETVRNTVEGVGHYEPLRHYAEVHLLIEPIERGSGVVFNSKCDTDDLDRNWQRLILTHLSEKIHKGVLTGSPVTDVKITLMSGRAHIKHTEGGDFRQATYRAVRQGLMQAESVLLEPYYDFRLEVPNEQTGRAISDIQMKRGTFDISSSSETVSVIKGRMPVVCADGYAAEVASYTGGRGKFSCVFAGYGECGDAERVIEEYNYDAESDLDNTADSVFCTHGSGFNVKWNKVSEYMHLKSCIEKKNDYSSVNRAHRPIHIDEDELEAIMEREFGPIKRPVYSAPKNVKSVLYSQAVKPSFDPAVKVERIIIDGYNVIFAWKKLKHAAEKSLESAREDLINIIVNYASFVKINTVIVFDAYRATGNTGSEFTNGNVTVVYTKEKETADTYIEKLLAGKKKTETVRVVTSDAQIQLSAVHSGVLRMSASEFESEVCSASEKLSAYIKDTNETRSAKIGEYF